MKIIKKILHKFILSNFSKKFKNLKYNVEPILIIVFIKKVKIFQRIKDCYMIKYLIYFKKITEKFFKNFVMKYTQNFYIIFSSSLENENVYCVYLKLFSNIIYLFYLWLFNGYKILIYIYY